MNSYVLIFCLFVVPNIGASAEVPTEDPGEVASNLVDQSRWQKEFDSFQNFSYTTDDGKLINVTITSTAPVNDIVDFKDIRFQLYTRSNPHDPKNLIPNNMDSLKNNNFDKNKRTVFVTHGWLSSGMSQSCSLIRDAYLAAYDLNVIVIDWSRIASDIIYPVAATKVHPLGKLIATYIDFLSHNGYVNVTEAVLIGHSLGAHVVGIAGNATQKKALAIYGLDAALPLFRHAASGYRISDTDAKHVELIHTNAGILGTDQFWGNFSFYMNGGKHQPGCMEPVCSHSRAYEYYAESISTTQGFHGIQCNSDMEVSSQYCTGPTGARMGGYVPDNRLENGKIVIVPVYDKKPFSVGPAPFKKRNKD